MPRSILLSALMLLSAYWTKALHTRSDVKAQVNRGMCEAWCNSDIGVDESAKCAYDECNACSYCAGSQVLLGGSEAIAESESDAVAESDTREGLCTVSEDPHIEVFDGGFVSLMAVRKSSKSSIDEEQTAGVKWLVRSSRVSIQARYMPNEALPQRNLFVRAIAVGGEFLKGNTLIVGSLEDNTTWNGEPILEGESSYFHVQKSDLVVTAERGEHSALVQDLSKENRGVNIELPLGVKLIVNRLHQHVNMAIKMPAQREGQDGLCGNFNGLAADDSLEMTARRSQTNVLPEESLFEGTWS